MNAILKLKQKLTPKPDKLSHFYWGFWYALVGVALYHFAINWVYIILIPGVVLGAGKEIIDKTTGNGNPEFLDFIFTIIPCLAFFAIVLWGWC